MAGDWQASGFEPRTPTRGAAKPGDARCGVSGRGRVVGRAAHFSVRVRDAHAGRDMAGRDMAMLCMARLAAAWLREGARMVVSEVRLPRRVRVASPGNAGRVTAWFGRARLNRGLGWMTGRHSGSRPEHPHVAMRGVVWRDTVGHREAKARQGWLGDRQPPGFEAPAPTEINGKFRFTASAPPYIEVIVGCPRNSRLSARARTRRRSRYQIVVATRR